MTQEELALMCDMQPSHIGQLERGEKSPTLETLHKIAAGLRLPLPSLVDFSDTSTGSLFDNELMNKINARLLRLDDVEKKRILAFLKTYK